MSTPTEPSYREILLSNGMFCKVSPQDYERMSAKQWHASWSKRTQSYYVQRWTRVNTRLTVVNVHREILGLVAGDGLIVDHINHDTLDNTRENLRIVTYSQNAQNRRLTNRNASGIKGVNFSYGKWRARIRVNNKLIALGRFTTPEEAHAAYCEAAKRYFGEYARNL